MRPLPLEDQEDIRRYLKTLRLRHAIDSLLLQTLVGLFAAAGKIAGGAGQRAACYIGARPVSRWGP